MDTLHKIVAALIIGTSMPRTFDFIYNLSEATCGAEVLGKCIVVIIAFALPCLLAAIVVGFLKFLEAGVSFLADAAIAATNLFKSSNKA